MNRHLIIVLMSILLLSPSYSTIPLLTVSNVEDSQLTAVESGGVGSSEEESIDSFDVHPESGRWENILDDSIEDRITDSQFEILTVQNETSGSSGYEMNRGTVKTDGKFEWRMKSDGSGNQTELWKDQSGDECDFTEGDQEEWVDFGGVSISVAEGIMSVVLDADFDGIKWEASSSITGEFSQEVYTGISFRAKSSVDLAAQIFMLEEDAGASETFDIDVDFTTSWQTFSFTWDEFDNKGSTENYNIEEIRFDSRTAQSEYPVTLSFDFIKLIGDYDFATHPDDQIGDTWDWETDNDTESWTGLLNMNVSDGFLRGTMAAAGSDTFNSPAALNIDTNLFNIFSVRLNTSDITMDIFVLADLGAGFVGVSPRTDIDSTSQTIYTFDLSDDVDWTGTCIQLLIGFDEQDETLDGDEIVYIDYVLLLGEFNPSDSVIGLMDSVGNPLLNISTHFYGNDSARFEFELLDSTGELSYHWYSDLYDDLNQFIIGKAVFDVLRSKLEITLTAENNSRIDKITFPNEFIVDSGLTPPLFSNVISPDIFVSTFTNDHSWQSLFLDWIKVDFKRAEWVQTDTPSDSDWLEDRWDLARTQDDISDDSAWDLYVPYLDTVSASLTMQFDNKTLGIDDTDIAGVGFQLIAVDWDDGEEHPIYQVSVVQFRADDGGLKWVTEGAILENGSSTIKEFEYTAFPLDESPRMSFSMSLSSERTIASCKVRFWHNRSDSDDFFDFVAEINITTSPFADISQEFILRTSFTADLLADNEFVGMVEDFGFTDLDIFQDIANAVIEPIGNFLQTLFTAAFKFLADIFKGVGDVLGVVFTTVGTAITGALTTLQTALGTAIGLVETAIATLETALGTAIGLVETAIGTLETALGTAIGLVETAIGTLETAFGTIIDALQSAFETAIGLVQGAVEGVFAFLVLAMADIIDEIITVLLNIIADIIDVFVGIIFFLWDAVGFPDFLAIIDLFLVNFVELITAIPAFVIQVAPRIFEIINLGAIVGVIFLLIVPAISSDSVGEFIEKFMEYFFKDVTMGVSILGFSIPVPIGLLWMLTVIATVLSSTIFGGFFT